MCGAHSAPHTPEVVLLWTTGSGVVEYARLVDMGDWTEVAAGQDAVISRDQLAASGVSSTTVTRMVARGELHPLGRTVFLVGGAPLTYRARLNAALLATDGVLGCATAAHLWGMTRAAPERIDVVLPHSRRVSTPAGVRIHRAVVDPQAWLIRDWLRMTTRSLTVLDHAPTLPVAQGRSFLDRAIQQRWLDPAEVMGHLERYPGRHGNGRLRRFLPELGDGAAADSERLLHRILNGATTDRWTANRAVWSAGELVGVVDVAFDEIMLAIEVDGWAFHSDVERFRRDRRKQNASSASGGPSSASRGPT